MQVLLEYGMIKVLYVEEWGGFGMDWFIYLMVFEEVVYILLDIVIFGFINVCGVELLWRIVFEEIQQKYIFDILVCNKFIVIGILELDVGLDVVVVKICVVFEGDYWVINGEKIWIINGEYVDVFICICFIGEGEFIYILVDCEEYGFEMVGILKMVLNGQFIFQVFLFDVCVFVSNIIGECG